MVKSTRKTRIFSLRTQILKFLILPAGIILFLLIPLFYFRLWDNHMLGQRYPLSDKKVQLDSQLSDLIVLQKIHLYLEALYSEEITDSDTTLFAWLSAEDEASINYAKAMQKELILLFEKLDTLLDIGSLLSQNILSSQSATGEETGMYSLSRKIPEQYEETLEVYYDAEVGKILSLRLTCPAAKQLSGQELLELQNIFLEYLNLDLINDWYQENGSYVSNSAHLRLYAGYLEDGTLQLHFQTN